jgi:hypothetical protein
MSELSLYENIMVLGRGIEACLEKGLVRPAAVLIYTGIEVASWLASSEEFSSGAGFMKWVEAYLLKAKPLKCTALDLWAARCGFVHTLTPYAKPIPDKKPRLICYAHGSSSVQEIEQTFGRIQQPERFVAAHISDLYEAWRLGVLRFVEELEKDQVRKTRAYKKADKFFYSHSADEFKKIVAGLYSR